MSEINDKFKACINDFKEQEIAKERLLLAKFNRVILDSYEIKIKAIEDAFNGKAKIYGKKLEECKEEKDRIISKYEVEFQKIYDIRKEQFFNIQMEISEARANQMIAIANIWKVLIDKQEFILSPKYQNYINEKNNFSNIIDTTLNKAEFDKYTQLLENLKDPIESYNNKIDAVLNKYAGYDEMISRCEIKLGECIVEAQKDFDVISKYVSYGLIEKSKVNPIFAFINKIVNSFAGKSRFNKDVVVKMENELADISNMTSQNVETIENQTIMLVQSIEDIKAALNEEFKVAVG